MLLALIAATAPPARAGGALASATVLDDRVGQTGTLWDGSFDIESRRLVKPVLPMYKELDIRLEDANEWTSDAGHVRRQVMKKALAPAAYQLAGDAESRDDPDEALAVAEPLGASLRHYLAAVVAFREQQFGRAASLFATAGEGSATARQPWPLLARFMVAQCAEQSGDIARAVDGYRKVIADVQGGQADPASIGLSSLGALGRIHGRRGEWKASVLAYAQEAASNAPVAPDSLRWVASRLVEDSARLRDALEDPLTLNLMVLFAFTHFPGDASSVHDRPVVDAVWTVDQSKIPDAASVMKALHTAVRQADPGVFRNPDQVAAAAYRHGWYDLAKAFADRSEQPLALWVRAKLAVRDGDVATAAQALSRAASGMDDDISWNTPLQSPLGRSVKEKMRTEQGMLALSRGELVEGFEFFLRAGAYYWLDIAYLADRVLDVDELGAVVARLDSIPIAGPTRPPARRATSDADIDDEGGIEMYQYGLHRDDVKPRLRLLYARRLLREGRLEQAVVAFSGFPAQQKEAERYVLATKAAAASEGERKAFHLFAMAQATRNDGMSLLAYEAAPDFKTYDGNYVSRTALDIAVQLGAPAPWVKPDGDDYVQEEAESAWQSAKAQGAWWSEQERRRLAISYDRSIPRYSYRWTAADLASQAADLLPVGSRSFGQVLCHAAEFVAARTPKKSKDYYQRFLRENGGPPWRGGTFGWNCPAVQWPAGADGKAP